MTSRRTALSFIAAALLSLGVAHAADNKAAQAPAKKGQQPGQTGNTAIIDTNDKNKNPQQAAPGSAQPGTAAKPGQTGNTAIIDTNDKRNSQQPAQGSKQGQTGAIIDDNDKQAKQQQQQQKSTSSAQPAPGANSGQTAPGNGKK